MDEIHLLVILEYEVELLINVSPWTPVELVKQHLILLLGTVLGIVKIQKNRFSDRCWDRKRIRIGRFRNKALLRAVNFRKLLSWEEKLSAIILKVEDLLTLGLLCTFKSAKLGKKLFADKSCFQKWYIND